MNRGYTIRIADISRKPAFHFFVDREEGQYLGHVSSVLLDDGKTILCVYPKGHGFGTIILKKSTDGGKTWSDRIPVPRSWETSLETPTLYKTYDKDGGCHILLFSGMYPIRMAHSEDNGETWSELEPIGRFGGITAMGDVIETAPGEYAAFFHDEGMMIRGGCDKKCELYETGEFLTAVTRRKCYKSPDGGNTWEALPDTWIDLASPLKGEPRLVHSSYSRAVTTPEFRIYMTRSEDGGLTWGEPREIAYQKDVMLCEPCAVHSPDGKQIAVLLRENSRKRNSFLITSDDNGETWSEPRELPGALTGDRHCARYSADGRLVIFFRDAAYESPTKNSWAAWVGTYGDLVSGREGQYRIKLLHNYARNDCGYAGVTVLPDDTFAAMTYGYWEESYNNPFIKGVRFKLSDTDRLLSDPESFRSV